jgi:serine protease AprX
LDDAVLRRFVFQTFGHARRTQDSPIMPDVWMRYIRRAETIARATIARAADPKVEIPTCALDLLLTPWLDARPGDVAAELRNRMPERRREARIAESTTRVVASVDFLTLVRVIMPLTGWCQDNWDKFEELRKALSPLYNPISLDADLFSALTEILERTKLDIELIRYAALVGFTDRMLNAESYQEIATLNGIAALLGASKAHSEDDSDDIDLNRLSAGPKPKVSDILRLITGYENAVAEQWSKGSDDARFKIFLITYNRPAALGLFESRNTVKGDAAQRVFEIDTAGIKFAVIDGGIDATHPGFFKWDDKRLTDKIRTELETRDWLDEQKLKHHEIPTFSRIAATYDFTILRDVIANGKDASSSKSEARRKVIEALAKDSTNDPAFEYLQSRSENALGRDIDWGIVEKLITVPYTDEGYRPPGTEHGTHVAGILGAKFTGPTDFHKPIIGMCPNMSIYDMRVFDSEGNGDEFAILCALEFVGWKNRDRKNPVIHGVNLSLALRHEVDSFACGQTPICEACNHLVGSGTVVVAAAGNTGFEGLTPNARPQSLGDGYRSITITDPGNAEAVITVGSTHRRDPHLYGVSFFSGRGPTGDGRRKPDILAPGEKVRSIVPRGLTKQMDGTSMAAPHVSGAAVLLMARYPELIGRPLRIKEILMASATDLKREHYFQGAGLLDVLRSLQSV